MVANTVELFLKLQGQQEALSSVKGITTELERAKQETKRSSLVNQQERLKERLQVQQLAVEEKKRAVILRGKSSDIRASLNAQNQLNAIQRQQLLVRQRLANFDAETKQVGTTGWDTLRNLLQKDLLPMFSSKLPGGIGQTMQATMSLQGGLKGAVGQLTGGLGGKGLMAIAGVTAAVGVGLVGAIGLATSAVTGLVDQLLNTQTEMDRIVEKSKLQSLFGVDSKSAMGLQQQNEELVRQMVNPALAKDTVLTFQYSFIDEIKDKNPNLSQEEIFKKSINIAQGFTAIQQTSGQDPNQLRRNIDDIVSGTRTGNQIDNLEFFTNLTPSQKKTFKKVYEQQGGLAALEAVATMSETVLLMGESANSTQARLQKIQETMFGRDGMFSVERDLDKNKAGYQNVRAEFNRSIDLLFGAEGLFSQLSQTFGLDGIDIMVGVNQSLKDFNDLLENINKTLAFFQPPKEYREFKKQNNEAFDMKRSQIEEARKGTTLDKIMQATPFTRLGEFIATNILKGFSGAFTQSDPNKSLDMVMKSNPITRFGTGLGTGIMNLFSGGAKYQGTIQSMAGGRIAYDTEYRNRPAGSAVGFMVNSGEDILPPGKLKSLLTGSFYQGAQTPSKSVSLLIAEGAIKVYPSPNQDPISIAKETLSLLTLQLEEKLNAQLT
jgi:hypothetical protein